MSKQTFSLRGQEYPLCFNATAMLAIEHFYGSFSAALRTLNGREAVEPALRFLHALILGGAAKCKALGESAPEAPEFETLAALLDLNELMQLPALVAGIIDSDSRHETEAAPPKNADGAPADNT